MDVGIQMCLLILTWTGHYCLRSVIERDLGPALMYIRWDPSHWKFSASSTDLTASSPFLKKTAGQWLLAYNVKIFGK